MSEALSNRKYFGKWMKKNKWFLSGLFAYFTLVVDFLGTDWLFDDGQKWRFCVFNIVLGSSLIFMLCWCWLRIKIVTWFGRRLLLDVVRKSYGLADKLELLTFYFLEESKKSKPRLHGVLWTLHELTEFEQKVPERTEILIERPAAIEMRSSTELNDVMRRNRARNVTYKVLDRRMPAEWKGMQHVMQAVPKHRTTGGQDTNASLVLPSYGMVLYKTPSTTMDDFPTNSPRMLWHRVSYVEMKGGAFWIAGFVLIPIPQSSGTSDSYLALHMGQSDIDELIHRIY